MHFAKEDCNHELLIRAFEAGRIVVGNATYERSLLVSPSGLIDDWRPQHFDELEKDDFQTIANFKPEIILLGTGRTLRFPGAAITADLLLQGIGVEVMDTAAACRTFNILLSEGRNVTAALLLS